MGQFLRLLVQCSFLLSQILSLVVSLLRELALRDMTEVRLLLHFNPLCFLKKLPLSFCQKLSFLLFLLSCSFSLVLLLNLLAFGTSVVLNPVLFLELLLSEGTDVEFVTDGPASVHDLLGEETTYEFE